MKNNDLQYKYKPIHVRDSQRQRVYRWEHSEHAAHVILSRMVIELQIEDACAEFGIKQPEVVFNPRRNMTAVFRPSCNTIEFSKKPEHWSHNHCVVLHETAHAIDFNTQCIYKSPGRPGHGPIFMGIYLYLLDKYTDENYKDLLNRATRAGVAVSRNWMSVIMDDQHDIEDQ